MKRYLTTTLLLLAITFVLLCKGIVVAEEETLPPDKGLANKIKNEIQKQKKVSLKHLEVTEVSPGHITIEGIADLYGEKYIAQKTAEKYNLDKIDNNIIVNPDLMRNDTDIEREIFNKIKSKLVDGYFDDVSFKVSNGVVQLFGKISRIGLIKKIMDDVIWIPGVRHVENTMTMLPVSQQDDSIRRQILQKMRNDMRVSHYFAGSFPNIIIIVEGGKVTLKGYVNSNVDKVILEQIAKSTFNVLSVINMLEYSQ
ncbi:MAG: hypothetical protein A2Y62_05120 [Candidatus Fischerbacteria bacterium RBG_13_37_8]|uniref:BON domain-containing protein n=1 Tax=Candidatus Fischerbacteria bacterium RBG_13_37_8 TaxID=1817863 RepID=A0A1F5V8I8_9BACT|nr:MAG: hypothetical protein A2Y62_05120 [Candidatus Fischerbacteria bacterium RBG_13_37_8]